MIKTLRITTVIAAVLAGVVFFVVFPAILGVRSDQQVENFLNSPSTIEKFKKDRGTRAANSKSQISPLVNQARAFALYLNPPQPRPRRTTGSRKTTAAAPRPQSVSSKFKLVGTSFFALHPELSLALIDEPGKGLHWVRQSGKVGRLIIEQVKDGSVVVRDGKKTFEQAVTERPKKTSLIKGSPSSQTGPKSLSPILDKAGAATPFGRPLQISPKNNETSKSTQTPVEIPEQRSDEEILRLRKLAIEDEIAELKAMKADFEAEKADSGKTRPGATLMDELIRELEAMRISIEEAENLDDLGKQLQDNQQDPNQSKGRKIEKSKSSRRQRRSRRPSQ